MLLCVCVCECECVCVRVCVCARMHARAHVCTGDQGQEECWGKDYGRSDGTELM